MTATLFCPYCGAKFSTPQTVCPDCGKQFGGAQRTMLGMSAKEILEQARKERESTAAGGGSAGAAEGGEAAGAAHRAGTPPSGTPASANASGYAADAMAKTLIGAPGAAGAAVAVPAAKAAVVAPAAVVAVPAPTAGESRDVSGRAKEGKIDPAPSGREAPGKIDPAPSGREAAREAAELDEIVKSGGASAAKWIFIALLVVAILGGGGFAGYVFFLQEEDFIVSHDVERKIAGEDDGHVASAFVVQFSIDGGERPFSLKIGDEVVDVEDGTAELKVRWKDLRVGTNKVEAKIHGKGKTLDYDVSLVRPFSITANADKAASAGTIAVSIEVAKGFKAKVDGKEVSLDKKKGTGSVEVEVGDAFDSAKDGKAEKKIAYVISGEGKGDKYSGSLTVELLLPEVPVELVKLAAGDKIPNVKGDLLAVRVKAPGSAEVLVNGKKAKKDAKEDVFEAGVKLVKGENDISVTASAPRHKDAALKVTVSYEG